MSMIYECPHCHRPQEAGNRACPHCGVEFDGSVPEDAFVPAGADSPATPVMAQAEAAALPPQAEAVPPPQARPFVPPEPEPPLPEVKTPLPEVETPLPEVETPPVARVAAVEAVPPSPKPPPYRPQPVFVPPPYVAPPAAPPEAAPPPVPRTRSALSKILLIAVPVVLVLVLAAVFFAHSLDSQGDMSAPPPLPAGPSAVPPPAPVAAGSPLVLPGGASASAVTNPAARVLLGRWQAKSDDYYVFNPDGSGARGSLTESKREQSFLWSAEHNRLVLYGDKTEHLRFNRGPDADTLFLRASGGRFVQYTRAKT